VKFSCTLRPLHHKRRRDFDLSPSPRRAASRFSMIEESPRQTNSLLQGNFGQMMERARRQIARAMKFVVFFGNWRQNSPKTLKFRFGNTCSVPSLWRCACNSRDGGEFRASSRAAAECS